MTPMTPTSPPRLRVSASGIILCTTHGEEAIYIERTTSGLPGFWRCPTDWCPARGFYDRVPR